METVLAEGRAVVTPQLDDTEEAVVERGLFDGFVALISRPIGELQAEDIALIAGKVAYEIFEGKKLDGLEKLMLLLTIKIQEAFATPEAFVRGGLTLSREDLTEACDFLPDEYKIVLSAGVNLEKQQPRPLFECTQFAGEKELKTTEFMLNELQLRRVDGSENLSAERFDA